MFGFGSKTITSTNNGNLMIENKTKLLELELQEFKNYKNDLEHLKKITIQLLKRCETDGINQNFSCNSEIVEIADKVKFTSYKLYSIQNYLK